MVNSSSKGLIGFNSTRPPALSFFRFSFWVVHYVSVTGLLSCAGEGLINAKKLEI